MVKDDFIYIGESRYCFESFAVCRKGKTWKRICISGLESRFQDVVSFRSNKDLGKVKHDDDSKLRIMNTCSVITRMSR